MAGFFIVETTDERCGKELIRALVTLFNHAVEGRTKTIAMPPYHVGIVTVGQDPNDYVLVKKDAIHIGYGFLDGEAEAGSFRALLAKAVERDDRNAFEGLRGHFAGASLYPSQHRLIIATNRFASVPIFWAEAGNMRIWAPEIPACLYVPGVPREIDRVSIMESLLLDAPLGDRTPFRAVHHLPPASVAYATPRGVRVQKYWYYHFYGGSYQETNLKAIAQEDLVDQAVLLMRRSVEAVVEPERPTLLFLSGGLDSRTIVGFAAKEASLLRTITFGARGAWDLEIGQAVACAAGIEGHRNVVLDPWHYVDVNEEGVGLTGGMLSYPHFHIFNLMRHHGNPGELVLTGLLGDPNFGALSRINRREPGKASAVVEDFYRYVGWNRTEFVRLADDDTRAAIRADLRQVMDECVRHNQPADFHEYYSVAVRQPNFVVFIEALVGMFHAVRMPFLNYDLSEFFCSLPEAWRHNRRLHRLAISNGLPELADIPEAGLHAPLLASPAQQRWALLKRRARGAFRMGVEMLSGGRISPIYPRWVERHMANLNGPLRPWLLLNLDELEQSGFFPPGALEPFRKRSLEQRHAGAKTRLISLATIMRWIRRWPQWPGI